MKKQILILTTLGITVFNAYSQNSPLTIYGNGLDGSTYQKTTIYSDLPNGLLIEAPLDASGERLPITFSWRGGGSFPLYIKNDGKIGIGTTQPTEMLHIKGSTSSEIRLESDNGTAYVRQMGTTLNFYNNGERLTVLNNGNVGIACTTPEGNLQIGTSTCNGMVFLGGGKNYTGIGSTRSDAGLILGKNIYARYNDANDNGKALVGGTGTSGFAGLKFSQYGIIDFFSASGSVNENDHANATTNIRFRIASNGNVGIGTTTPTHKLAVNGTIRSKEIIVDTDWADFVFESAYKLKTLEEVEEYIKANKHLPDVPSEKEVKENGISLGQSDALLLQKIEELTLYVIEQNKKIQALEKKNGKIQELEQEIKRINTKN